MTVLQDACISNARDVLLMVQNDRKLAESLRHFLAVKKSEEDAEDGTTLKEDGDNDDAGVEFARLLEEFHHYATGKYNPTSSKKGTKKEK